VQLFESCHGGLQRSAPERQRLAELVAGAACVAARQPLARSCRELLEALQVQLAGFDPEQVSGWARHDAVGAELLPQLRDVHLQGLRRARRRVVAPQVVDQALRRNDAVPVQ
jgi:hypothetical protein